MKLNLFFLSMLAVWALAIHYLYSYQDGINNILETHQEVLRQQGAIVRQLAEIKHAITIVKRENHTNNAKTMKRLVFLECQTDVNSAGFRSGHIGARKLMLAGVFDSCNESIRLRHNLMAEAADE